MRRLFKHIQPSILAGNISTLCLWINMLMLVVILPVCIVTNATWFKPFIKPVMLGAFILGSAASSASLAPQSRQKTQRP